MSTIANPGGTVALLSSVTTTGSGDAYQANREILGFQAIGVMSSGTGTASIDIQGTLDGSNWKTVGTLSLTALTTATSNDVLQLEANYYQYRGTVTAISTAAATVSLYMRG